MDFGGFSGAYSDLMKQAFPRISFDWVVVDLPGVIDVMAALARPGLRFESDLKRVLEAPSDIALASASINYVPEPLQTLKALCSGASATVLTRLPLWPLSAHQVAVQRTQRRPKEISYPTWFFSEQEFLSDARECGEIVLDFECPDDRASFAGHYSTYRGLVISTGRPGKTQPT